MKIKTISTNLLDYYTNVLSNFFKGKLNTSLSIGLLISYPDRFMRLGIYPRKVMTPEGLKLLINDSSTLSINVFDHYIKKEYLCHKDYIPRKNWLVLDIGAHIGLYTLYASRLVKDQGLVIAFEPNLFIYHWLRKNIILNKLVNVKTFPIALAEEDNISDFYCIVKGNTGQSSLFKKGILKSKGKYIKFKVLTRQLDSFLEKNLKQLQRFSQIDLVKIDAEGAELRILEGAKRLLQKQYIQRLIVEVHLDIVDYADVMEFLKTYDYRVEKIISFNNVKRIIYVKAIK